MSELLPTTTAGQSNFDKKLKNKALLLDNPQKQVSLFTLQDRAAKRNKPQRMGKVMSSRERRERGLFRVPKECAKFALFEPLNKLWTQYIYQLLPMIEKSSPQTIESKLVKADLHGALLTVVQSKNPGYVGATGILVQETQEMFKLVTRDDRMKVLPKANSIFSLEVGKHTVRLYGNHIRYRPSFRASKKFKRKNTIQL